MKYDHLPKIPSDFFNSDTRQPFENCLICDCDLLEQQQPYAIERAFRYYPEMALNNVVFEYALCAGCTSSMENELSSETKKAVMGFFSNRFDPSQRPIWNPETSSESPFRIKEWTDNCAINGMRQNDLYEYTLCARCINDRIIPDILPYMISGPAQDELVGLFSNASMGFLDDFTDRYFSGPPELKELFKGRPILV